MYENIDKMQYTPMIRQYLTIKEKYQDTIIFFRLGDFYEMFFNDAILASKELEIVLTGKDAGTKERVPMCGVPFHSASSYIDRLTEKGYKVAIVEQTETPQPGKDLVTREVVKIVTPGTVIEGSNLDDKDYNFLTTVYRDKDRYILAYCDPSTGENFLTNLPLSDDLLYAEILKLKTREIVISPEFNLSILNPLKEIVSIVFSVEENEEEVSYLKELTSDLDKIESKVFNRLLNYIIRTQMKVLIHMQKVQKYNIDGFLRIDLASRRNLELLETLRFQNKKNTLLSTLDKCKTAMGSRFLKKAITFPLKDIEKLEKRYDIISLMKKSFIETEDLRIELDLIYDLERIVGKLSYENVNPKDLLQLKKSLSVMPEISTLLKKIKISDYFNISKYLPDLKVLYDLLDKSIDIDAPFSPKDGGVIKSGFSKELDDLRDLNNNGKDYLLSLEAKERERTGIKTLKVGFNRVFGYFIEVTKSYIGSVKEEFGYIRKQTLANAERYITQELKEKETLILRAEEKSLELEYSLFSEIRSECKKYSGMLQELSKIISELDMMQSFTRVSGENNYVRPKLNTEHILEIKNGRHPVLDVSIDNYIPNDTMLDESKYIELITGPNMSGKSTYMRQVALISIMAQIGCFVPATSAKLPVFDSVYTRIGASDDIVSGQSTFMVEMNEVNNALTYATSDSLILFDEIGRGTATYDGMALAQSIIEYIHENIKCKTLFSTHYHELTALDQDLDGVKNVHVSAEETNGNIVFMHKVLKGSVDKSYGINVAKLANLPLEVILRAEDLLNKLQMAKIAEKANLSINSYQAPMIYDSKTEQEIYVINKIKEANLYEMSPMDCINLLDELKKIIK